MSTLNEAHRRSNLERAWLWIKSNPDEGYKSYCGRAYSRYALADTSLLDALRDEMELGDLRLHVTVLSANYLLQDLGRNAISHRVSIIESALHDFSTILSANTTIRSRMGETFREQIRSLDNLAQAMVRRDELMPWACRIADIFATRSSDLRNPVKALGRLDRDRRLSRSLTALTVSFLHMHINRLMREVPNVHELAIYDWLRRMYRRDSAMQVGKVE